MSRQGTVMLLGVVVLVMVLFSPSLAATRTGTVRYNGQPVKEYIAGSQVYGWVRDESTGNVCITCSFTYDPSSSTYTISDLPDDGYFGVEIRTADYPNPFFPGNYYGWTNFTIPDYDNPDLNISKLIHLKHPIDNDLEAQWPPPYDLYFYNSILFDWDPISEASTYEYELYERQYSPDYSVYKGRWSTDNTSVVIPFAFNQPGYHYELSLYAFNSDHVQVGMMMIVYTSGWGWDYRFVIEPPTPITTYEPVPLPIEPGLQNAPFDNNQFNFGIAFPNEQPQTDVKFVVQPIAIKQSDLDILLHLTPFDGATLVPYYPTGDTGILFHTYCATDTLGQNQVPCPLPPEGVTYDVKTGWKPTGLPVLAPAFLKFPGEFGGWQDILTAFYETRVDPTGTGRTCCRYSDFVLVDMGEGGPAGTPLPSITITTPVEGAVYMVNAQVRANYSCNPPSSTDVSLTACVGSVPAGQLIDTSSSGNKSFQVNAFVTKDARTVSYVKAVGYQVVSPMPPYHPERCLLYDPTKPVKQGAAYPIKLKVCDQYGNNLSSPSLGLTATAITNGASIYPPIPDSGNSNPGGRFRYDSTLAVGGGYIYTLSTRQLKKGTYMLHFTIAGDTADHIARFVVK